MDDQLRHYANKLAYEIDSWDLKVELDAGASVLVVDARSPDAYRREHIPGALNRFFKDNLDPEGRFKPAVQLRRELLQVIGGAPPERVVHQCGSGVSACHNLLGMDVAGLHGARLYPGSWSEWCADERRRMPSLEAIMHRKQMFFAPRLFMISTASTAEPPVASIGSAMTTRLSATFSGRRA